MAACKMNENSQKIEKIVELLKESDELTAIQLIQSEYIDINSYSHSGKTLLMEAISYHCHKVIDYLLDRKANANLENKGGEDEGTPALFIAMWYKNRELVEKLLSLGVNINVLDSYENTPLAWASSVGDFLFVKMLLNKGADINISDKLGRTPLILACRNTENIEVVKLLIQSGANVKTKDTIGWSCLDYAEALERGDIVELINEVNSQ